MTDKVELTIKLVANGTDWNALHSIFDVGGIPINGIPILSTTITESRELRPCDRCGEDFEPADGFWDEDGQKQFCSEDCRDTAANDAAVARAESRSDWI